MSEQSSAKAGGDRSFGEKVKRTVESKVLIPVAATVVSAAVSYLARKLPVIIEEKLLPKLKETGAPELAKKVETAASVLPGTTAGGDHGAEGSEQAEERSNGASAPASSGPSNDEREAERSRREERRQERKRALSSA